MIDFQNSSVFKLKPNDEYAQRVGDLLLPSETIIGAYKAIRDGVVRRLVRGLALSTMKRCDAYFRGKK